jgi:hypothetical protein
MSSRFRVPARSPWWAWWGSSAERVVSRAGEGAGPVVTALNHARLLLVPGAVAVRADVSRLARVLRSPDVQAVL